ncbi:hypothetical protein FJZ19_04110 [Candidatus Pacearchaeota archaeon]|nr:hypothetical protein [Candidatus Pacearchaeota archaeon]
MKPFEYYLNNKDARKSEKNLILAESLINDIKVRLKENWNEDEEKKPKLIFENIYDALRDFFLAILLSEGYKTNSHEAPISYLSKRGFDIYLVERLNQFRYKRNGSKYYGEEISTQEAEDIKAFYLKIKEKVNKLIKDNNLE